MSAAGRGAVRRERDFYATPDWLTSAIVPYLMAYRPARILEPCAGPIPGRGAIADLLKDGFSHAEVVVSDLAYGIDFLDPAAFRGQHFDLICTNPPYSEADKFVQRALELRGAGGAVCMLLRLNWLGTNDRAPWLRAHVPTVYVTPRRPSFTGDSKTDATEYCWAIWDSQPPRALTILPTERKGPQVETLAPPELFSALYIRGMRLSTNGTNIHVTHSELLTADDRAAIVKHKAALLELLPPQQEASCHA